jgi:aryl-alcohol dehydrogenase-like predicted oxidoreductase
LQTTFENTIPRPVQGPLSAEQFFALKSPALGVRPVRRLVLGTAWAGGVDPADAIAALHAAWGAGFEMVDTAPMYRNAEQVVGEALKSWRGDRPVVSTKTKQSTSVD